MVTEGYLGGSRASVAGEESEGASAEEPASGSSWAGSVGIWSCRALRQPPLKKKFCATAVKHSSLPRRTTVTFQKVATKKAGRPKACRFTV
jgi:hypothetical protein